MKYDLAILIETRVKMPKAKSIKINGEIGGPS